MTTSIPGLFAPVGADATLVCVGNLTIDEAVHHGIRSRPAMGGDAAYAALAAKLYLDDVSLLAPIGTDLPSSFFDTLAAAGIAATDLPRRDLATVRNVIDYHDDGSRTWTMLASEADFDVLSVYPADVPTWALDADGFVLSAMSLDAQLALTPWLRANTDAMLYLDLQEDYLEGTRTALFGIIGACDVFLPSEIEAVTLAGTNDLDAAARLFRSLGPQTVVIKRAEQGCLVLDGDTLTTVPTDATEPVDSTGAGDAFCGAFAAVHLQTGDAIAAARAGASAARIAIGAFGIDALSAAAVDRAAAAETAAGTAAEKAADGEGSH